MTLQIGVMLGLLAASLVLFSFDWVAPDVVALGLVVAMVWQAFYQRIWRSRDSGVTRS
jgi:hypothetical protein